ncbi:hypothetical protein CTAYLR_003740 [Chrysophaeum taylorii]|uniref:tRNA (Uracil-5-)-methyltransferase n=1 Tax=Chrysophaeum taylorii TaxID=2483200 RepID=A0AAD7UN24_9STRA|nr:hypothetical protein CTAYLR_003740 [Chrysophaeum taylorii]
MGRYGGGVLASSFSARRTSTTTTTTTTVSSNKIDVVLEAFSSGFEAEVMLAEEETQYRQRCRFSVGGSGAELHYRVGERRVDSFELASPRINAAMPRILRTFENLSLGLRAVHFHAPRSLDFPILVSLVYASPFDEAAWLDAARTLLPEIHCVGRSKGLTLACDRSSTLEKLFVDDRTFVLEFPEGSFCHPNARANERSLEWLCARLRDIGECDLLELYCGAANHTVTLAALCRTVVAVEVDATLVAAARRNLDRNGVTNATVLASDASKYCARLGAKIKNLFDALLVDPPRRGLDPKTRRILRHYDNVLYVSCNPAALQTDLDFLAETHQIRSFAVLDAFPRTPHLECLVHFERKDPAAS